MLDTWSFGSGLFEFYSIHFSFPKFYRYFSIIFCNIQGVPEEVIEF